MLLSNEIIVFYRHQCHNISGDLQGPQITSRMTSFYRLWKVCWRWKSNIQVQVKPLQQPTPQKTVLLRISGHYSNVKCINSDASLFTKDTAFLESTVVQSEISRFFTRYHLRCPSSQQTLEKTVPLGDYPFPEVCAFRIHNTHKKYELLYTHRVEICNNL